MVYPFQLKCIMSDKSNLIAGHTWSFQPCGSAFEPSGTSGLVFLTSWCFTFSNHNIYHDWSFQLQCLYWLNLQPRFHGWSNQPQYICSGWTFNLDFMVGPINRGTYAVPAVEPPTSIYGRSWTSNLNMYPFSFNVCLDWTFNLHVLVHSCNPTVCNGWIGMECRWLHYEKTGYPFHVE